MRVLGLLLMLLAVDGLRAGHKVKLQVETLEWNGLKKNYSPAKTWTLEFSDGTETLVLDTLGDYVVSFNIKTLPIYHDNGFYYGFLLDMFDGQTPVNHLETQTRYTAGMYEAGSSTKGPQGNRKWSGSVKYTPDTSLKYKAPSWRKDHYTLTIGSIETWRNGEHVGKPEKNVLFEGHTGETSYTRHLGRTKDEKITLNIEAVRYSWRNQTWIEFILHYYAENNGKKVEFLAHTFKSTDKNILRINREIHNAYDITDKKGNRSLVLMVKLIPY